MKVCLFLGFNRSAWALRRTHCPVGPNDLVLEIGSGGSPYFRANVLVEPFLQSRQRHWAPLVSDRPLVLAFGERLPFKDGCFDFVIASHVLEHSAHPEKFLLEMQRVAKAGYIETPDAFMEMINPYWDHRSEIHVDGDHLIINKKSCWRPNTWLTDIYELRLKEIFSKKIFTSNPFHFHTRFFWKNKIKFKILNPKVDATWDEPKFEETTKVQTSVRAVFGRLGLKLFRYLFSQHSRNRKIKLIELLQCNICYSHKLVEKNNEIHCLKCGTKYLKKDGYYDFRA